MNDREAYEFYLDPEHLQIAGPARKHPKDKLTAFLSVRVSPALRGQVSAAASAEGRSPGSWVRQALRSALRADKRQRPEGLIPGSGRRGEPKALPSSLRTGRTFCCPHLSISNVMSASCGTCGHLSPAA